MVVAVLGDSLSAGYSDGLAYVEDDIWEAGEGS
jgi:hypothetical protein